MTQDEFQQAVRQLQPQLIRQARRYIEDTQDAADVVQDALLRLWQMHERLQQPVQGLAMLVTRNLCIDRLRRRRTWSSDATLAAMTADEADNQQRVERVMAIVEQLPDVQQTLLRLRHMEGLETKQLAEMLQMSEAAVRQALCRARQAVRQQYLKLQNDEE